MKCSECKEKLLNNEDNFVLPLPVFESQSIIMALEKFFRPVELNSFCKCCQHHVKFQRKTEIWKQPKVLVIQLQKTEKSSLLESTPMEALNLNTFLADKTKFSFYSLFAVCKYHKFGPNDGHYFTDAKTPNNKWYRFDDDKEIKEIQKGDILNQYAYILFYEKIN